MGEESVHLSLDGLNPSFAKVSFGVILCDKMVYFFFKKAAAHLSFIHFLCQSEVP